MSILRAKTQMLKQKDRLIAKIAESEDAKVKLDKHIVALNAQIEAIESALFTLDGCDKLTSYQNPDGN